MATEDDEWEDYNPLGWENDVAALWEEATRGDGWNISDEYGMALFEEAYVRHGGDSGVRSAARDMLQDWFSSRFGIDFDDSFDWEGWRAAYDAA
jgi:hypothetical protein